MKSYNEFIKEDFELSPYKHSMDLKGFFIHAEEAGRGSDQKGFVSQPGHYSFAGIHTDPTRATKYDTQEEAEEYIEKLEQELTNVRYVPVREIITTVFEVKTHNGYSEVKNKPYGVTDEEIHEEQGTFFIEAKPIPKEKVKELVEESQERIKNGYNMDHSAALFYKFEQAKLYITNKVTARAEKAQKNLESIKNLDLMDVKRDKHWFTSFEDM